MIYATRPRRFSGPRQLTPAGKLVVALLLSLAIVVIATSYGPGWRL